MGVIHTSYSRWLHSRWYCYYSAASGFERDDQVLEICDVCTFRYKQLKEDFPRCLDQVRGLDPGASPEEINELKGYMEQFMKDVETDKEIQYYEELKMGDLTNLTAIVEWSDGNRKEELKKHVNEAFQVLCSKDSELPLIMAEIETELGKTLLEKRFKGIIKGVATSPTKP